MKNPEADRGLSSAMMDRLRSWQRLLRHPRLRGFLLGLLCALVVWLLAAVPVLRTWENWLQDSAFSYRGVRPSDARILLVSIDDAFLRDLNKPLMYLSPELAEVVAFLKGRGATAIGIDVLVPENLVGNTELEAGRPGDAPVLGTAIRAAGNVVLPQWRLEDRWLRPLPQWQLGHLLSPRATDLGFVNFTEDDDFFARRQQLLIRSGTGSQLSFAMALYALARKAEVRWTEQGLRAGDELIPVDGEQKLRINFLGPPGSVPRVPFGEVLEAARQRRPLTCDFRDAVVIIGVTAPSGGDFHVTPYANGSFSRLASLDPGLMCGSEIEANVLATLLDGAFIQEMTRPALLFLLLCFGAILGKLFAWLNLEMGAVVALVHHAGWVAFALLAFRLANWRLVLLPMLALGFLTYTVTFGLRWRRLRTMLGVMKSEAVARALEADPRQLDRRGEERTVTVLFADIRYFTPFAEQHSPHEVLELLNAVFSAIVPILEAHGGTINQYAGDGVMTLFGAPASSVAHAVEAVRAAVAVVRSIHEHEELWHKLDKPGLRVGIGINTGTAIVGTVGSPRRLDYTALGDTTNTAARIEAENKHLGTEILISTQTYDALPAEERVRLGCQEQPVPVDLKGKKGTVFLHVVRMTPISEVRNVGKSDSPESIGSL